MPEPRTGRGASSSTPRRSVSPAVYRRRRLVALIALLVVVALVVWAVTSLVGGGKSDGAQSVLTTETPTSTPTPTGPPSYRPDATDLPTAPTAGATGPTAAPSVVAYDAARDGEMSACTAATVRVEAHTDKQAYTAAESPKLWLTVTNTGQAPCHLNAGTKTQGYVVSGQAGELWRSRDCQVGEKDAEIVVPAGEQLVTPPIFWNREQSSPTTCGQVTRPAAPGGGASYQLTVTIGGLAGAAPAAFTLG